MVCRYPGGFQWERITSTPFFVSFCAKNAVSGFNSETVSLEELFMAQLREKIINTDIDNVKKDVMPYIDARQLGTLDIWSNDYSLQLVDLMKIQS